MDTESKPFQNPFRPGAGHMPPYLAGRDNEITSFQKLLKQETILENLVITGLRGVGKTVLLDTLRPFAMINSWLWVGTDLSETVSVKEENLATRLLADLAVATSSLEIGSNTTSIIGFKREDEVEPIKLDFPVLRQIYNQTPGLTVDKLKAVLNTVNEALKATDIRGIIFAYDEAQNLADNAPKAEYPLSVLLDLFQSIQKSGVPFMLCLAGLPTLFSKLVDARTFAERMFHVMFLDSLDDKSCKQAVLRPIQESRSSMGFSENSVKTIISVSGGYPYFVQFICRECFDIWIHSPEANVPVSSIVGKLDEDFFAGRWTRATDRQRDLLIIIAYLDNSDGEFTGQEIATLSEEMSERPFGASHINQMLAKLSEAGLIYKNRHGKYSFAVPLLDQFIRRQYPI